MWESAAYGEKCRDGKAEFQSEGCLLSGQAVGNPGRQDRAEFVTLKLSNRCESSSDVSFLFLMRPPSI